MNKTPFRRALSVLFLLICGVFFGTLVVGYFTAGDIYDYQDSVDGVHLPQVDAIVCLAGGRGRIAAAGDIWYRYWELAQVPLRGTGKSPTPSKPPILYISGMGHYSNWNVLKRQVRRGVLEVLTPGDVVLERQSTNTEENAQWLAQYAADHAWNRILLVTSRYHMRRARMIFERVLENSENPVEIETLSVYQEPFEPGEWRAGEHGVRVTVTEYVKWLYYKTFWNP